MMTTLPLPPASTRPLDSYLASFDSFERNFAQSSPSWLRALRKAGIAHFDALGFPTVAHEEWRFTDVAPMAALPFRPVHQPILQAVGLSDLAQFAFDGLTAHQLVFVDGHFAPGLSQVAPGADGLVMGSLAAAVQCHTSWVEPYLGRTGQHQTDAFAALNTAFLQDGAFVYARKGTASSSPIHLLFISTQAGSVTQPRNLIVAEAGAEISLIEDYVSLNGAASWTNSVTEVFAGENSTVTHLKLQREAAAAFHVANIEAHMQARSRVSSHSIALGGRLTRNTINLRFQGQGCEGLLNGLFFARGEQLVDHHTVADHAQPHCNSHEFYHGILAGQARGVFIGKILVRPDAQKTDAKQTNKNLLLGADATINSKPQLEIFADDVKCTHGATVGQLDDEAIFYLRSRGLGEAAARQMLVKAFASDVLNRIPFPSVRQELDQVLGEQIDAELNSTLNLGTGRARVPH